MEVKTIFIACLLAGLIAVTYSQEDTTGCPTVPTYKCKKRGDVLCGPEADVQCASGEKCCVTACNGRACTAVEPVSQPGQCPFIEQYRCIARGTRNCESNINCDIGMKCCTSDHCGSTDCKTV